MVKVDQDGISLSGLNTQALLAVSADLSIKEICSLPRGCHNAMPIADGVIFNDTASDTVRLVTRHAGERSVPVPTFPAHELDFMGIDDSKIARQGFGRGLCLINQHIIRRRLVTFHRIDYRHHKEQTVNSSQSHDGYPKCNPWS